MHSFALQSSLIGCAADDRQMDASVFEIDEPRFGQLEGVLGQRSATPDRFVRRIAHRSKKIRQERERIRVFLIDGVMRDPVGQGVQRRRTAEPGGTSASEEIGVAALDEM